MKIKDICELIIDCPHSTAKDEGEGYPLIRTPNIGKGRLLLEEVHRVSEDVYKERIARGTPQDDDLILAREAPIGNVAIIKNGIKVCLGQRTVLLRPDKNRANPDFLVYYLLSPEQQGKLVGYSNGATVNHLNMVNIRNLDINIPDIKIQKHIASILSAYDDLIETNQKQIKLLEEAAQRLYKEWFVDLRFPGHEDVEIVDGVPSGWEWKNIGNIVATTSGGTPSRSNKSYYENGTVDWIKTKELEDGFIFETEEKITEEALNNSSAKLLKKGNIILAMYGATIGKLGILDRDMSCNQACCVFKMETFENGTEYLFCWLLENREYLISQGKGAAQPNLSQESIKAFKILVPDSKVLCEFSAITRDLFQQKRQLQLSILRLQETRDRLLPKLMSREVGV